MTIRSTASVATVAPARYAEQLLAHLGRQNTVEALDGEPDGGRPVFSCGTGTVRPVDGQLVLLAEAPDVEGLAHVEDTCRRHALT